MNLKGGFIVLFKLFLRNIVITISSLMIVIWLVPTLTGSMKVSHIEILIIGLVGFIVSLILIRKL